MLSFSSKLLLANMNLATAQLSEAMVRELQEEICNKLSSLENYPLPRRSFVRVISVIMGKR